MAADSEVDLESLIEAVLGFPCIWQVKAKSYKNRRARENAWKAVASSVGFDVEVCMKKRKNLRDKFIKELKKVRKHRTGDEGPPSRSSWPYFDVLKFLEDTVMPQV